MRSLWGFAAPIIWGILPASSGIVLLFATMSQVFSDAAQLAVTVCAASGGGISGGISMLFALPAYQQGVGVPAPQTKGGGRGVPDVAGDADPDSGYRIITGGQTGIIGGTSAVAPLWAGIVAGLNAARKAPLGQIHAQLYGHPAVLRDGASGNNKSGAIGFEARKGWGPCTGLGSPDGGSLKALLGSA